MVVPTLDLSHDGMAPAFSKQASVFAVVAKEISIRSLPL
jgi:hypothetical protein